MDTTYSPCLFQEPSWLQNLLIQMIALLCQHGTWLPDTCSPWGWQWHGCHGYTTTETTKGSRLSETQLLARSRTQQFYIRPPDQQAGCTPLRWWHSGGVRVASALLWTSLGEPLSLPAARPCFHIIAIHVSVWDVHFSFIKTIGKKWLGFENEKKTNFANKCTKALLFWRHLHLSACYCPWHSNNFLKQVIFGPVRAIYHSLSVQ